MEVGGGPADRIRGSGLRAASPVDLLALMLSREAGDEERNEAAASRILRRHGLVRLTDLSPADLRDAAGLEGAEADRILAAIELGRRSAVAGQGAAPKVVTGDQDAADALRPHLSDTSQERFVAVFLNVKNHILGIRTMHIGTINQTVVGAREVFREALRANAASLIVGHNHPSGDPTPSPEDRRLTRNLKEAGEMLDVPLLDHIIIAGDRHLSFQREGLL